MTDKRDDDTETTEPKGGRPGPVDNNGTGGMATRELAADRDDDTDD